MNESFEGKKEDTDVILKVSGLNAYYRDKAGIFTGNGARKQILKNVSFEIRSGRPCRRERLRKVDACKMHSRDREGSRRQDRACQYGSPDGVPGSVRFA